MQALVATISPVNFLKPAASLVSPRRWYHGYSAHDDTLCSKA